MHDHKCLSLVYKVHTAVFAASNLLYDLGKLRYSMQVMISMCAAWFFRAHMP